jgi:hypothetical protein
MDGWTTPAFPLAQAFAVTARAWLRLSRMQLVTGPQHARKIMGRHVDEQQSGWELLAAR